MTGGRDLLRLLLLATACTSLLVTVEAWYQRGLAADPTVILAMQRLLAAEAASADRGRGPAAGAVPDADLRSSPRAWYARRIRTVLLPGGAGEVMLEQARPHRGFRVVEGPGMWGPLLLLIGFDVERQTVIGLEVLSHNETPGIGSRIGEPRFTAQFRHLPAPHGIKLGANRIQPGTVDAITGATVTSLAIRDLANAGIAAIRWAVATDRGTRRPAPTRPDRAPDPGRSTP